jgi:hypothetical protein
MCPKSRVIKAPMYMIAKILLRYQKVWRGVWTRSTATVTFAPPVAGFGFGAILRVGTVIGGLWTVSGDQLHCFGGTDPGSLFQGNSYNHLQIYQP